MKKIMTVGGFESPNVNGDRRKFEPYRSVERKNAIVYFIQAGVALGTLTIIFLQVFSN